MGWEKENSKMIYNVIRAITSYIITLQIDVPTMCFFFQQYIETRSDLYLKPFQHFISVDSLFSYIMVGTALTVLTVVFNLFFCVRRHIHIIFF